MSFVTDLFRPNSRGSSAQAGQQSGRDAAALSDPFSAHRGQIGNYLASLFANGQTPSYFTPGQGMNMGAGIQGMAGQGINNGQTLTDMATQGLPVGGQGLPVAGQGLPVAGQGLPVAGQGLPVAGQGIPIAGQGMANASLLNPTSADIQNDPVRAAQMRSMTNAVQNSAAASGTLDSGGTLAALQQNASDITANAGDRLYARNANTFGLQNQAQNQAFGQGLSAQGQSFNQGFNNQNTAFNQGFATQGANFGQGMAAQQQDYAQRLGSQGQGFAQTLAALGFGNNAQNQGFAQNLAAGGFTNAAQGQMNQQGNQYLNFLAGLAGATPQNAAVAGSNIVQGFNAGTAAQGSQNQSMLGSNGSLFGTIGNIGSWLMASDERLKTDVEHIGKTHAGLPIYSYKYKWGGPRQMGVMAQELEKVDPSAVYTHSSGFKLVDYGKVH